MQIVQPLYYMDYDYWSDYNRRSKTYIPIILQWTPVND